MYKISSYGHGYYKGYTYWKKTLEEALEAYSKELITARDNAEEFGPINVFITDTKTNEIIEVKTLKGGERDMSQLIRFKDLVKMLNDIDCIQVGYEYLFIEDTKQLAKTNPWVYIERIESACLNYDPDVEAEEDISDLTYYISVL